jgi:hypothetical protein
VDPRIQQILEALLQHLQREGLVELAPGARADRVAARLHEAIRSRAGGVAQFGATVSAALIADPDVVELFADDATLASCLSDLDPPGRSPRG